MDLFRKYGLIVLTVVAVFTALIFYTLNIPHNREANVIERSVITLLAPVLKPAARLSAVCGSLWGDYIDLVGVRRENLHLLQELRERNARIVAAEEDVLARQRLERLLDMKATLKSPTLTAAVVGEDVSSWFRTLVIDRGSSSGVAEGMAVVAAGGVVGQVVKVAQSSARVLLLTDHASGIAALLQRSRARGVVKGKEEGLCSLEFTTREEDVKVGDVLVTSGIGGVFPKGLPIGEVAMVKRGEYGIFQTVTIRPAVTVSQLEEVMVILKAPHE